MRTRRIVSAAVAALLVGALSACGGGSGTDAESRTITYWASVQGASPDADRQILEPLMQEFEQQTGITVDLEVVPWTDLTNNTLAAAVSGIGPDVINLGNTNAATFHATGAFLPFDDATFAAVGGKDKFVEAPLAAADVNGEPPTSLPLYSQVYALYYNKQMFADAGLAPPTTWQEMVTAAQRLTDPAADRYGFTLPGGTVNVGMHLSYILGAQNGGSPFDASGRPNFTNDGMVAGVKQYVDLMAADGVVSRGDAQFAEGQLAAARFAGGHAAMMFGQNATRTTLVGNGMDPSQWGIVPIPAPDPLPAGGRQVGSFAAGTNIAVFGNTDNKDGALRFVQFMTDPKQQATLSEAYGSLPVVKGVEVPTSDDPAVAQAWQQILAERTIPLQPNPNIQAYQTNVGGAVVELFARAATGGQVSTEDVRAALQQAQDKMPASS
jgi:multiple sugar transport system substrate-binding protein